RRADRRSDRARARLTLRSRRTGIVDEADLRQPRAIVSGPGPDPELQRELREREPLDQLAPASILHHSPGRQLDHQLAEIGSDRPRTTQLEQLGLGRRTPTRPRPALARQAAVGLVTNSPGSRALADERMTPEPARARP